MTRLWCQVRDSASMTATQRCPSAAQTVEGSPATSATTKPLIQPSAASRSDEQPSPGPSGPRPAELEEEHLRKHIWKDRVMFFFPDPDSSSMLVCTDLNMLLIGMSVIFADKYRIILNY